MPYQPLLKIPLPQPSLLKLRELIRGVHPEAPLELLEYNKFHIAVSKGDRTEIKKLLKQKYCVDQAAEDVDTQQRYRPLNLAVKLKQIDAINLFLNLNAAKPVQIKNLNDPLLQGALAFWDGFDLFLQQQKQFPPANKKNRGFLDKKTHPFSIALKKNPNYMWRMVVDFGMGQNVQALGAEKFEVFLNYIQRHLNITLKEIQDHLNAASKKDEERTEVSRGIKPQYNV